MIQMFFPLLLYFIHDQEIETTVTMKSPKRSSPMIVINQSVIQNADIIPSLLAIHAIIGCDSVPATFNIGKLTALSVARKGYPLVKIGHLRSDMKAVLQEATKFMSLCYGVKKDCQSMTECQKAVWCQRTGKGTSPPKIWTLPPTTESFEPNVYHAHYTLAFWYSSISGQPPNLLATDYGWEADHRNKMLIPCGIPRNVQFAPDTILKIIRCSCASEEACKSGRCSCMHNQLACTIFCNCGGKILCHNLFKKHEDPIEEEKEDTQDT